MASQLARLLVSTLALATSVAGWSPTATAEMRDPRRRAIRSQPFFLLWDAILSAHGLLVRCEAGCGLCRENVDAACACVHAAPLLHTCLGRFLFARPT